MKTFFNIVSEAFFIAVLITLLLFLTNKTKAQSVIPQNAARVLVQGNQSSVNYGNGYVIPAITYDYGNYTGGVSSALPYVVAIAVDSFTSSGDSVIVPLSKGNWTIQPLIPLPPGFHSLFLAEVFKLESILGWIAPVNGLFNAYCVQEIQAVKFVPDNYSHYGNIYYWVK